MNQVSKEDRLKKVVVLGLERLSGDLAYAQNQVVAKLAALGVTVSTASLSNIKNGKPVGLQTLSQTAKGIENLLRCELDLGFDLQTLDFVPLNTPGWTPMTVSEEPAPRYILHEEGRVSLAQKTALIDAAKRELIEVGIRLNSLSHYFISQNETVYKDHIIAALRRGVHIKGYLLDPNASEAMVYFNDRARAQASEKESIAEIKKVIERFKVICAELDALQLPGKFEIYLYKHIPYSLFFAIDGDTEQGRMMVSPYLYGISRANCPVLEINKANNPRLFRKYWESAQLFMDGAQKLVYDKSVGK